MRRESRYRPWIIFLVFCCSSNTCFTQGIHPHDFASRCEISLQSTAQNRGRKFRLSSHHHVCNCHLYIVTSHSQLTLFLVSYPASTALTVFLFDFLPANQKLSIYCQCISIFKPRYPLLWWPVFREPTFLFPIHFSLFIVLLSLSLSFFLLLISFSYMFLSFPLSYGWLLKQLTRLLNHFTIIFTSGQILLGKVSTPYPLCYVLNSTSTVFPQGGFGIR